MLLDLETTLLYVPIHILLADGELCARLVQRGRVAAVLPRIVHDGELPRIKKGLEVLRAAGVRDALVGNLGLIAPVREAGMRVHGDFGLNIFNSASMNVMRSLEMASATVSFEMTLPQIRDMSKAVNAELIAYGRLPLMVTEHCLIHNKTNECTCHLKATRLIDKTGAEFPVIRDGDSCRSVLLNGKKLSWLDRQDDLAKLGLWATRLYFTTENSKEVDRVLNDYMNPEPLDPARVPGDCTYGVWNKILRIERRTLCSSFSLPLAPAKGASVPLWDSFTVRAADIDETMDPEKPPFDEVARVSRSKALAVSRGEEDIVIAADTIVVCQGRVLGKPRSEAEAASMLRLLSGRDHQVMTGCTILYWGQGWDLY